MIATTVKHRANHRARKLLLACCLGAAAVTAQAYPGKAGHTPPDPAARASHMQVSLQLSDSQTSAIKGLLEASARQRQALAQKYTIAEREAFAAELKTLREQTRAKIDAVLTAPQKKARDAQRQRWAEHHERHGRGHFRHRHHRHHCGPDHAPGAKAAKPQPAHADAD